MTKSHIKFSRALDKRFPTGKGNTCSRWVSGMLVAPATFSRTTTAISTDLAHQAGTKAAATDGTDKTFPPGSWECKKAACWVPASSTASSVFRWGSRNLGFAILCTGGSILTGYHGLWDIAEVPPTFQDSLTLCVSRQFQQLVHHSAIHRIFLARVSSPCYERYSLVPKRQWSHSNPC